MNRAILLALVLALGATRSQAADLSGEDGFLSLEMPVAELEAVGERCPIRVTMPLPNLGADRREHLVGALARYVHCQGVRISHVSVRAKKGPLGAIQILASASVIAPEGQDSTARLKYELVGADGETYSALQTLDLDEGELNWGNGVAFGLPPAVDLAGLALRIVLQTPAGVTAVPAGRRCTVEQILKMRDVGVTDEKIQAVCGEEAPGS